MVSHFEFSIFEKQLLLAFESAKYDFLENSPLFS